MPPKSAESLILCLVDSRLWDIIQNSCYSLLVCLIFVRVGSSDYVVCISLNDLVDTILFGPAYLREDIVILASVSEG